MKKFFKDWMLPIAMTAGVLIYLLVHFCFPSGENAYNDFAKNIQPIIVSFMLFFQFNVVRPGELRVHRCFFFLLAIQTLLFVALGFIATGISNPSARLYLECAMLCFVCPTAAAAGVVTEKIGGSISEIITYTILINITAALIIPLVFPLIHPSSDMSFLASFFKIVKKVFSILVIPFVMSIVVRYTMPRVQKWFEKRLIWAFYLWACGLTLALSLATKSLFAGNISLVSVIVIALITLFCCLFQFWLGRKVGKSYGQVDMITCGQALGQKNTGFIIWLGYSFLTPVTSIVGGFYSIYHNVVNSIELASKRR